MIILQYFFYQFSGIDNAVAPCITGSKIETLADFLDDKSTIDVISRVE
jgi:hypothetical protein